MVKIEYKIRTVPEREKLLNRLLNDLKDDADMFKIYTDHEHKGTDWNMMRALSDTEPDTTHVVTLEDDVIPSDNFIETVKTIIETRSDNIISLLYNGKCKCDYSWVKVNVTTGQGIIFPTKYLEDYIQFKKDYIHPDAHPCDTIMCIYAQNRFNGIFCTNPSLLFHDDEGESVTWNRDFSLGGEIIRKFRTPESNFKKDIENPEKFKDTKYCIDDKHWRYGVLKQGTNLYNEYQSNGILLSETSYNRDVKPDIDSFGRFFSFKANNLNFMPQKRREKRNQRRKV